MIAITTKSSIRVKAVRDRRTIDDLQLKEERTAGDDDIRQITYFVKIVFFSSRPET
jgi:hypothetical protein